MTTWIYIDGEYIWRKLNPFQVDIIKDEIGLNGAKFSNLGHLRSTYVPLTTRNATIDWKLYLMAVRVENEIWICIVNDPKMEKICRSVPPPIKYQTYGQFLSVLDSMMRERMSAMSRVI